MMRISAILALSIILISTVPFLIESDAQPVADYNKPDLAVLGISFRNPDENHMNAGETTHISVMIGNEGQNSTGSGWTVSVYDNERLVKESAIDVDLDPGSRYFFNFTWKLRAGWREFLVIVDSDDVVEETIEYNNELSVIVEVEDAKPVVYWWVVCLPVICVPLFVLGVVISVILFIWRMLRSKKKRS